MTTFPTLPIVSGFAPLTDEAGRAAVIAAFVDACTPDALARCTDAEQNELAAYLDYARNRPLLAYSYKVAYDGLMMLRKAAAEIDHINDEIDAESRWRDERDAENSSSSNDDPLALFRGVVNMLTFEAAVVLVGLVIVALCLWGLQAVDSEPLPGMGKYVAGQREKGLD